MNAAMARAPASVTQPCATRTPACARAERRLEQAVVQRGLDHPRPSGGSQLQRAGRVRRAAAGRRRRQPPDGPCIAAASEP
jgi:hypothetical protein